MRQLFSIMLLMVGLYLGCSGQYVVRENHSNDEFVVIRWTAFDLEMGMTKDAVERVLGQDITRDPKYLHTYLVNTPAKFSPTSQSRIWSLRIHPEYGLYMFRVFKVVETDPLEIKVKKEYLAIKGRLEERYGKRTKKYERSTKDIMWSRPDWFMRSLRYDKRMHASVWSFNSGMVLPQLLWRLIIGIISIRTRI